MVDPVSLLTILMLLAATALSIPGRRPKSTPVAPTEPLA